MLIIAMSLGTSRLRVLLVSVTAFTFGHAITLTAGCFNYIPQATWFIPFVEMAIAATLITVAVSSLRKRQGSLLLYTAVGLLHGLGFSFVLGKVLQTEATDLVPALFSFMLGIELAQFAIVSAVLTMFFLLRKMLPDPSKVIRSCILAGVGSFGIALFMQRLPLVLLA